MKLFELRNLIDALGQHYAYEPNMTITEGKKALQKIVKAKADKEKKKVKK
tara:strand:- start:187 stop:336 length:150 start_codon:yes stop_codon:yes gene_type:complete